MRKCRVVHFNYTTAFVTTQSYTNRLSPEDYTLGSCTLTNFKHSVHCSAHNRSNGSMQCESVAISSRMASSHKQQGIHLDPSQRLEQHNTRLGDSPLLNVTPVMPLGVYKPLAHIQRVNSLLQIEYYPFRFQNMAVEYDSTGVDIRYPSRIYP